MVTNIFVDEDNIMYSIILEKNQLTVSWIWVGIGEWNYNYKKVCNGEIKFFMHSLFTFFDARCWGIHHILPIYGVWQKLFRLNCYNNSLFCYIEFLFCEIICY